MNKTYLFLAPSPASLMFLHNIYINGDQSICQAIQKGVIVAEQDGACHQYSYGE